MTSITPPLSTPGYDVTGRVFIITGGTQGLGLGIARQLKEKGAAGLVVVSRNQTKGDAVCAELSNESCTCRFVLADLGDAAQAQSVVPQAVELMKKVGPISGLVNAAAITARGNLFTTTPEGFDLQMAINVRAPMLLTQSLAKHMVESKTRGSIVNISSVASHGGAPFIMAYSASKAALNCLTTNNAAELAPHGIRVNAVNMGWTVSGTSNVSSLDF
jgi:NAD(P)-dependent dehydrogenase (short-subunit alcohol dehydrogenase family)